MSTQSYTTAQSTTWTAPTGVYVVQVECWGGGGNGQHAASGNAGGGGGYSKLNSFSVTPGNGYAVVVGAIASQSYFVGVSTCLAKGGANGVSGSTKAAGGDAASGVGDVKYSGGSGGLGYPGQPGNGGSGGGGGAAGPDEMATQEVVLALLLELVVEVEMLEVVCLPRILKRVLDSRKACKALRARLSRKHHYT